MPDTSLSRFVNNVISSGLGKSSTVFFGIFCMLIYARWMAPVEYGTFVFLQVLIGLGLSFGEFGMDTASKKFIASTEDKAERQKIINVGIHFKILSMILISLIIYFFQDNLYQILGGNIPRSLLIYLPIMLFVEGILSFYSCALEGMFNFKMSAVLNFTYGLTSLILTIVLVIPFNMGAQGLVWARLLPKFLCLILAIAATKTKLLWGVDWKCFKRIFKFGIPLYGNSLLAFAYGRTDTIIIGYFFGPAEIAIYDFARRIPDSLNMLYDAFNAVYFPFITNLNAGGFKEKVTEMINHANRLTCFLGGLGTLLAFGFGEWFFRLFFSERYLSSVPPFIVLMILLIFIAIDSNLGSSLVALGEPEKPLYINIFRFGMVFACYFLLIPYFKIIGAVLSSIIGLAIVNPLNVFFLRKHLSQVKMDVYIKPLILLGLGCASFFFIGNNIITTLALIAGFIVGCYLLGIIQIEDITIIRREAFILISRLNARRSVPKP